MRYLPLLAALLVLGCQPAGTASTRSPGTDTSIGTGSRSAPSSAPPWVNRVWVRNDAKNKPGELRLFLANGTLIMDSCWETYRLASWEARSDSIVVWHEDTAKIEAHLEMLGPRELQLRLMLVNGTVTERYHEADTPYLCPEMKR